MNDSDVYRANAERMQSESRASAERMLRAIAERSRMERSAKPWEGSRVYQKAITSAFSPPTFLCPSLPFFPILSFAFPFSFSLLSLAPSSHCPFIRPFSAYFVHVCFSPHFSLSSQGDPRANFFHGPSEFLCLCLDFDLIFQKKCLFPRFWKKRANFKPPLLHFSSPFP